MKPCSLCGLAATVPLAAASSRGDKGATEFDWNSITPSANLQYHDCYSEFKCARLVLPLDWLDENSQDVVTIAITKRPAAVKDDDASFGGTIFAQPGGPGVSGTMFGRKNARRIQDMLDRPGKKHYEILSFDPRRLGHSTPKIDCFPGLLTYMRDLERINAGSIDLSPGALAFSVAAATADFNQCGKVHGKYLSYAGTPNVARDIVAILDKMEELRQSEAKKQQTGRLELRSHAPKGLTRLQYIGISYGTSIGQYFASMFPGRVGRMVLDGVVDVEEAANGDEWLVGGANVDKILEMFFQGCYETASPVCALRHDGDTSGSDISRRVLEWADNLNEYPLVAPLPDGNRVIIRGGIIYALFFQSAYNPPTSYQSLAKAFEEAMKGNASSLIAKLVEGSQLQPLQGNLSNYSSSPVIPRVATMTIGCVDGTDVTDRDNSFWRGLLQKHQSISSTSGAFWASIRLLCAGWHARPNWSFNGPFTTPEPTKHGEVLDPERPAAPLFFTSNRYDPATPFASARLMRKSHPRSGLLVQNTAGHCILSTAMGPCSKNALANYFDTGILPDGELVCETLRGPWDAQPDD